MLVGRRVTFCRPNGQHDGTLQLRHNNELRLIRNEPNFAIVINPPLPLPNSPVHPFSQHPFQQHAKPHDPPVRSRITWHPSVGWTTVAANDGVVFSSASSLLKSLIVVHRVLAVGGMSQSPPMAVDRSARGGYLDGVLTRSPHTPLDDCSHVMAHEVVGGMCRQSHWLTSSNDPFIAWIAMRIPPGDNQNVEVTINTSEAPAAGVANDEPSPSDSP
ncbi:unnamed protein product [Vitrella brassicaformis CCMP3155]|uniref:Uncharacterized protein n=2 Tax=Vitrella brassicaformis TaxID=1169539 RepID=A0A0G4EHV8_VITBC|nr:unnamed protein product [Vitrella brassicaformis CCMP3155]|eukprot:CEL95790.1 unnamed protein product [Vitrella brassicaformis CCMP3155]